MGHPRFGWCQVLGWATRPAASSSRSSSRIVSAPPEPGAPLIPKVGMSGNPGVGVGLLPDMPYTATGTLWKVEMTVSNV